MDRPQKTNSRLLPFLTFGVVAGVLWALLVMLVMGWGSEFPLREVLFTLANGIFTGVLVTAVLVLPLRRSRLWLGILLGILALPLAAFINGVGITLFEMAGELYDGILHLRSTGGGYYFGPMERGVIFVYGSCATVLGLLFYPLSVSTTLLLRRVIRRRTAADPAASAAR